MMKPRIQVYTDPETKRRIELAAARCDVAVTEYCLEAIREKLAEDDMLEAEQIEIPIKLTKHEDLIADLRALQERIKTRRGGKLIDVDSILEQMREERDDELPGMH
ncbi:MAG: hypothetical protein M5U01_15070 [Ardenticatenaceae bacterium]|nr:hypothetical protein [Ardenticatenaceae bacterium]HBY92981.1 hypothetical protein [Chloroflexota bacterium]